MKFISKTQRKVLFTKIALSLFEILVIGSFMAWAYFTSPKDSFLILELSIAWLLISLFILWTKYHGEKDEQNHAMDHK